MLERPDRFRLNIHSPLANGLVFAGLGALHGTTHYHDSSLHGNAGTLQNMVPADDWTWVDELGRWGLDFAGDDVVALSSNVPFNRDFTVSAWVNFASNYLGRLLNAGVEFYLPNSGPYAGRLVAYAGTEVGTSTAVEAGGLLHVAVTCNASGQCQWYVNGTAETNGDCGTPAVGTATYLGNTSGLNRSPVGHISDPLIHNRALSLPEIQTLANRSDPMYGNLLLPPQRRWWPVVSAATPASNIPVFMHHYRSQGIA